MRNKKREFHAIVPEHSFTFHVRNDVPPKKGDLANEVPLHLGTRAATLVVMVSNGLVTYGIARCQWDYQFNKKLARSVASGRAKQAFIKHPSLMKEWWKQNIHDMPSKETGKDFWYSYCRAFAGGVIQRINERSAALVTSNELQVIKSKYLS